jgi:hypothetical protein
VVAAVVFGLDKKSVEVATVVVEAVKILYGDMESWLLLFLSWSKQVKELLSCFGGLQKSC